MAMKRGDVVLVTAPGDYGKSRPAVVVQSDIFNETHASIVVCLLSSDLQDAPLFRLSVAPTNENGLQVTSQIMVDKLVALKRDRIRARIGSLDGDSLLLLNRSLMLFLGLP
jgi:mRNA interferase MazF